MLGNFSWIEKNVIAASQIPYENHHFDYLEEQGIREVINLTSKPSSDKYADRFTLHHIPVPDFGVPDMESVDKFWEIMQEASNKKNPVLVHCFAGCGRTGTFLAIWLLLTNKCKDSKEAISYMRKLRPCSLETKEQQLFVAKYYNQYKEKRITNPEYHN